MNNPQPPQACYVMLHIGTGPSHSEQETAPLVVSDTNVRFELRDDVWIERLDTELAKHIQTACEPPNYRITNVPYDRHLYAFVRPVPDTETTQYEGMSTLFAVAALSRLINPTSIGGRYCAKVLAFPPEDSAIQSIQFRGVGPDVIIGQGRDWLSKKNAEELVNLMPWLSPDKHMHGRVHRAYWNHEYVMHSYYLDARWVLAVSGLEALISVGEKGLRRQFCSRVRQLAAEFQVDLSSEELGRAYRLRSKLAHAEAFLSRLEAGFSRSEQVELYVRLEKVLRSTIKRCLTDEDFGNRFRDDSAVQASWRG
jgi:hypothetical protein